MTVRLRLLPLVIFSATCLLSIKVMDITDSLFVHVPVIGVGESLAAGDPEAPVEEGHGDDAPEAMNAGEAAGADTHAAPNEAMAEDASDAGMDDGAIEPFLPRSSVVLALGGEEQPYSTPPLPLDGGAGRPLECTVEELAVLEALAARREVLDGREREVEARERQLGVAEQRIDSRIVELTSLQAAIQEQLDLYDANEEEEIQGLVKIYEAMKPKDAAPIFEELEMDILLEIISRMSSIRSAPILARMSPARAQMVTEEMARRMRERPEFLEQAAR